jgi:hypothetical protein
VIKTATTNEPCLDNTNPEVNGTNCFSFFIILLRLINCLKCFVNIKKTETHDLKTKKKNNAVL